MNPYQYAAPPRCPKCLSCHYVSIPCQDAAAIRQMDSKQKSFIKKLSDERAQMIDDRFMAAVCAVCGDMPTLEHLQAMGKVFISPDGAMSLTWGSPDNIIASVPPPSLP